MKLELPAPYVARPYRGLADHAVMASILAEYRQHAGYSEYPTSEQLDVTYANLTNCDTATDIALIEADGGEPVGYVRTSWEEHEDNSRDYVRFSPTDPATSTSRCSRQSLLGNKPTCDRWPTASPQPDSVPTRRTPDLG